MRRRMRYCVLLGSFLCVGLAWSHAWGEELPYDASVEQAVDHFINLGLGEAGVEAAPRAADATLVRRLTLDLAGRIPAVPEVRQYLTAAESDKRASLVDRLMNSPEFADFMAARFDWLITQGEGSIAAYLKRAFREKYGWDRMFRDVVLADLRDEESNGAIEFLQRRVADADRLTNDVSVVFFGVNISCAKCHDHFLAPDWTQDHYYGMKSFFSRTFDNGGFVAERDYGTVKFKTTSGEERQAEPMFLTSAVVQTEAAELSDEERKAADKAFEESKNKKEPPPAPRSSLREQLVQVALAEGESDFFAKAVVNRLWYHFFGAGFVTPLDQMHSENPPSHPELLAWLARDFVEHGYDLRRLIRGIVMSEAYARTSEWPSGDRPYADLFAVAMPRALTPMQMARSLSLATADPDQFRELEGDALYAKIAEVAAPNNRELFDQPSEDFRVAATESLWFTNSEKFEQEYLQGGLVKRLAETDDRREQIEAAVWAVLSRPPADEEVELLQAFMKDRHDRPHEACRQMVWALLAGSEFRFNY